MSLEALASRTTPLLVDFALSTAPALEESVEEHLRIALSLFDEHKDGSFYCI